MSKILVVEDNPDNMRLMSIVLKKHGHEVLTATTGQDGVRTALAEKPDTILMDILLPDIDGLEATRRIRAAKSMSRVPIIAITSFAMARDKERILAAGCNGYFEKPIDPLTIMDQIDQVARRVEAG